MTKTQTTGRLRGLLVLMLCLTLSVTALAVPARAADVDIMFNDPGVIVGGSVTVNVYTTGEVAGVNLTIVYDTDHLTYTGSSGGLGNASVQDSGGTITIVDYHSTAAAKFSMNLSFTAKAVGSTTLRPTACTVSDASGDLMSVEFASHSSVVSITSASSNCDLSALYIDPGTLSPAFSSGTTNYTVTVPNATTWLAVSPVKSDASATYSISGNDWLNVGLNYVTVTVTAGNGAQKTYTLAVTRQAAEATAAPDNTVDTTAVEEPVYVTAPDGSQLEVGVFRADQIPDGFAGIELSFNGENISAIRSADGTRTAVWCRGNASYGEGFYILDVTTGAASEMNIVTAEGGSWVILDAALASSIAPTGCSIQARELDGGTYNVYVPDGGGEYVIFYGVSPSGTTGLYQYDTKEKTIQRYGLSSGAVTEAAGWTILDPAAANIAAPAGYVLMEVIVDGVTCRGYVPASGESSAYFVLYARRDGSEPALYTYDIGEKTFQRFGILKAVEPEEPAETEDPAEELRLAQAEKKLRTSHWILASVSVVLLAALTAVAVLSVLLNRRTRR